METKADEGQLKNIGNVAKQLPISFLSFMVTIALDNLWESILKEEPNLTNTIISSLVIFIVCSIVVFFIEWRLIQKRWDKAVIIAIVMGIFAGVPLALTPILMGTIIAAWKEVIKAQ
jgi:Na+/glutamate symporter